MATSYSFNVSIDGRSDVLVNENITLEDAIDYLHSIGWLQKHDKEITLPLRLSVPPTISPHIQGIEYRCGYCNTSLYVVKDTFSANYPRDYIHFCSRCGVHVNYGGKENGLPRDREDPQ